MHLFVNMKTWKHEHCATLQEHVFQHDGVQGEVGIGASSFSSLRPSPICSVCGSRELGWLASGSLWSWDWCVRRSHSNERCARWGRNHSFLSPNTTIVLVFFYITFFTNLTKTFYSSCKSLFFSIIVDAIKKNYSILSFTIESMHMKSRLFNFRSKVLS